MNEVNRTNGQLGVIKCAVAQKLILPSNTTMMIDVRIDQKILTDSSVGITEMYSFELPDGVSVTPSLVNVGSNRDVYVELSNFTNNTVVLSPDCVICQVQSCGVN